MTQERDELRSELTTVEDQAAEAEGKVAAAEERADAAEQVGEQRSAELDDRAAALEGRATDVADQEAAVKEREAAVSSVEERVAETQIHNGIWTVGIDIEPGTYRVAQAITDRCYWAILRSGTNGRDIVSNDNATGGFPTVTLSEGQDFDDWTISSHSPRDEERPRGEAIRLHVQSTLEVASKACDAGRTGDGGRSLMLDMRGKDWGSGDLALDDVMCVLDELDVPDATLDKMAATRSLDGRQQDDWNGIEASWTYHPDSGLDVILELD